MLFGSFGTALGFILGLTLAVGGLGLVEDAEELFTLVCCQYTLRTRRDRDAFTVLTTLPDLSITAIVWPNGGMVDEESPANHLPGGERYQKRCRVSVAVVTLR